MHPLLVAVAGSPVSQGSLFVADCRAENPVFVWMQHVHADV